MKKSYRISAAVYPCPVILIATYNEDGTVNVMNAAWGCPIDTDLVGVCLSPDHKTNENVHRTGAFTLSFATASTAAEADFFGIASGNKMPDKFERTGYTATRSAFVNAPVIEEFPVVMECELAEVVQNDSFYCIVGKIVNTAVEEAVLDEKGKVAPDRLEALVFDQFQHGYYVVGEKVGKAWNAGAALMKK